MIHTLIDAGADCNVQDGEAYVTPLHLAATNGHEAACGALIQRGCNVNARDVSRNTPLHVSVANKRQLVFRLLLAAGASVRDLDASGSTILHLAASVGECQIAQVPDSRHFNADSRHFNADSRHFNADSRHFNVDSCYF